jgi:hypothetical protein
MNVVTIAAYTQAKNAGHSARPDSVVVRECEVEGMGKKNLAHER